MLEPVATLELFATKGVEYLIVIGYLLLLIPIWLLLTRTRTVERAAAATRRAVRWAVDWFRLPENAYFHRGHTWAVPVGGAPDGGRDLPERDLIVRVGLDDFAETLVGLPSAIHLPSRGSRLEQGERGWELEVDGQRIPMLSPVRGEVIAVNEAVNESPGLLRDPYGDGWLLEVRLAGRGGGLKNLLTGRLAQTWMADTVEAVRTKMSGDLGLAMQDGGAPVEGFCRHLDTDWAGLAADFFMTSDIRSTDDLSPSNEPSDGSETT